MAAILSEYDFLCQYVFTLLNSSSYITVPYPNSRDTNADIITPAPSSLGIKGIKPSRLVQFF